MCLSWALLACAQKPAQAPAPLAPVAATASTANKAGPDILDISVYGSSACAVRADHQVWCWGEPDDWLSNASEHIAPFDRQRRRPVAVELLPPAKRVFIGSAGICVTARDGGLYCLGEDWLLGRQLPGDGNDGDESAVVQAIHAEHESQDQVRVARVLSQSPESMTISKHHACALESGSVWCWGDPTSSSAWWLGAAKQPDEPEDSEAPIDARPRRITGLPAITQLSANERLTCGIDKANHLWCWGKKFTRDEFFGFGPDQRIGPMQVIRTKPGAEALAEVLIDPFSGLILVSGSRVTVSPGTKEQRIYDFGRPISSVQRLYTYAGTHTTRYLYYAINDANQVMLTDGKSVQTLPMLKNVERLVSSDGPDPLVCALTRESRVFCWLGESPPKSEEPYPPDQYVLDARQYLGWIPLPPLTNAPDKITNPGQPPLVPRARLSGDANAIVDLVLNDDDACALRGDGSGYCWVLGREEAPVRLPATRLVKIALSSIAHACAVTDSGGVMCWDLANNDKDGAQAITPWEPLPVSDAASITDTSIGFCVLQTHGGVTCLDFEDRRDQRLLAKLRPIPGIDDATQIERQHSGLCAVRRRGGLACWHERYGLLEYQTPVAARRILPGGSKYISDSDINSNVRFGPYRIEAMDGHVWQVAIHDKVFTRVEETLPEAVEDRADSSVRQAEEPTNLCEVSSDQHLVCWGTRVSDAAMPAAAEPVVGIGPIQHVATVRSRGCASDGTGVWCWGTSSSGRVVEKQLTRVLIDVPIVNFDFKRYSGAAVDGNGDLWAWGVGNYNPFALTGYSAIPVRIPLDEPLARMYLGYTMHCGVTRSHRVVCWYSGGGKAVPIRLPGKVTMIALKDEQACAIVAGGRTFCWNTLFVKNKDPKQRDELVLSQPMEISRVRSAKTVTVGEKNGCALTNKGEILCWLMPLGSERPSAYRLAGLDQLDEIWLRSEGGRDILHVRRKGLDAKQGPEERFEDARRASISLDLHPQVLCFGAQSPCKAPETIVLCQDSRRNSLGLSHCSDLMGKLKTLVYPARAEGWYLIRKAVHGPAPEGCERKSATSFLCRKSEIVAPAPITALAGSASSSWCALAEGGALYCTGENRYGQLGNGRGGTRTTPVPVALP